MTGTIRRMNREKSYGFLHAEGRDYFFHKEDCLGDKFSSLREGDVVKFEEAQTNKGPRARNVEEV